MRMTTTDGKEYSIPDMCAYCQMDTAGNHEANCPCRNLEFYGESYSLKNVIIKVRDFYAPRRNVHKKKRKNKNKK